MIKVNVKINNRSWRKEIKNPKKYFSEKLKKINLQISKLVKQQYGYFFKTTKRRKNKITFNILLTDSLNMKRLNKKFLRKCKKIYNCQIIWSKTKYCYCTKQKRCKKYGKEFIIK